MTKENKKFKPKENMVKAMEYMQDVDYRCSIKVMCEAVGMAERGYYYWFKNPEFCRWWIDEADAHFARSIPYVKAAMYASATGEKVQGSPKDREMLLQRYDEGFMPKSKREISGDAGKVLDALKEKAGE